MRLHDIPRDTPEPWEDLTQYRYLELWACYDGGDYYGTMRVERQKDMHRATFYSAYGHHEETGCEVIYDFRDPEEALRVTLEWASRLHMDVWNYLDEPFRGTFIQT